MVNVAPVVVKLPRAVGKHDRVFVHSAQFAQAQPNGVPDEVVHGSAYVVSSTGAATISEEQAVTGWREVYAPVGSTAILTDAIAVAMGASPPRDMAVQFKVTAPATVGAGLVFFGILCCAGGPGRISMIAAAVGTLQAVDPESGEVVATVAVAAGVPVGLVIPSGTRVALYYAITGPFATVDAAVTIGAQ